MPVVLAWFLGFFVMTTQAIAFPTISASGSAAGAAAANLLTGAGVWRAAGAGTPWVIEDLGTPNRMTALTLTFPASGCWSFVVDASQGGSANQSAQWTTLMTQDGSTCSNSYAISGNATFRYVRVTITGGGAAGLDALRIDGTPVVDDTQTSQRHANARPAALAAQSGDGTDPVVVMESCDLWSSAANWLSVLNSAPDNLPLAGSTPTLYDDTYPATTTARIALARQAGITAFQSCWYRQKGNAGQPVQTAYNGVIRALADTSSARQDMRWSLFWDNANGIDAGVAGSADFLDNLVPFWIDSYFSRSNYLSLDGRPVLVISSPDILASQLGGIAAAADAIAQFRARISAAGFPGIVILACNNASPLASNATAAAIGFDGVMSYSTPAGSGLLGSDTPSGAEVAAAEEQSWADWAQASILPTPLTVSMGYDATIWNEGGLKALVSPAQIAGLLGDALSQAKASRASDLRHRLIYIDNWNEYGEGRFVEPSLAYGGSYLNAISAVLCPTCGFSYSPALGVLSPPQ